MNLVHDPHHELKILSAQRFLGMKWQTRKGKAALQNATTPKALTNHLLADVGPPMSSEPYPTTPKFLDSLFQAWQVLGVARWQKLGIKASGCRSDADLYLSRSRVL